MAHAVWIVSKNSLANEVSWDGKNYNRQDSMGTRGTITFSGRNVVGVFRDDNSPRAPWHSEGDYSVAPFLNGMPDELLGLARDQALQFVVDEYRGVTQPVITSAFWSSGDFLAAAEPWEQVIQHGAHLINIELEETESAMKQLETGYELSSTQLNLIQTLFDRKMRAPDTQISLTASEIAVLRSGGTDGIQECRELFAAIGLGF